MINDSGYYNRFYEQFDYFKDYVGTVPFTFYPGTPEHLMLVKGYIAEFLGTDDAGSSSAGSSSQGQSGSSAASSSQIVSTGSSASSGTSSISNPSTGSSVTLVAAAAVLCAASVVAIAVSRKRK